MRAKPPRARFATSGHDRGPGVSNEVIRTLIRDVLSEEIGKARREGLMPPPGGAPKPKVHEEIVAIRSDHDLAQFVRRLAEILKDGRSRDEIEAGRWLFRLGTPAGPSAQAMTQQAGAPLSPAAPAPSAHRIERGIVTERQIEALPEGTTKVVAGKGVRFTPLARDRLRLRGIDIERAG